MKRMKNRDGQLTAYALLCGYVQTKTSKDSSAHVKLFMEDSHYHVVITNPIGGQIWEVYEINELTKSRETFKHFKKMYL